ncbi:putative RNA polymerase I-specific transcription initiation factor rrn3 [Glarea lozoyensis 74030]|uniref:Putative RNA polymerase I-specific transcription initiation factor rrn3 n=1 Tax=Glarea lozoyensis (strain ATCC 74030 / MF5533) TaxID=1104152 RepID=H0ECX6_GLAL7|nr:putative RNA polymerase I-specific transcription initiation factor rrn3 [Glarea lozoyensis 74030]
MVSLVPAMRPSTATTSKPLKPLLRRGTLSGTVRKLDDTDLDAHLISHPPSPSKRARVTFKDDVEEKVMVQYAVKGRNLEVIRTEVRRALENHARGDSVGFDVIKEVFAKRREDDDDEDEEDEEESQKRADIRAYVRRIVRQILRTVPGKSGKLTRLLCWDCTGDASDELLWRVHVAIKYLLRLIPSASGILSPIISKKFPDSEESKKIHVTYIENLLRLIEYAPELASDVFSLITDRVVKIDVEMQLSLDDIDNDVAVAVVEALSMNQKVIEDVRDEESDSDAASVTSEEGVYTDASRIKQVQANVEKMDAILDILWRDLLASPLDEEDDEEFSTHDLEWTDGIKDTLNSVIYSKLNPLKVCSPVIVAEFAKIARHLGFIQFSSAGTAALRDVGQLNNNESWHQLEAHFPFDPYQLPISKRWVEDDYVQWQPVPGLEPEEDDDSEDDDDEEVEVDEDTATDEDNE